MKCLKVRVIVMPKAILELKEMPKDCSECPCSTFTQSWIAKEKRVARHLVCEILKLFCPSNGRHKDCPIKEVEDHA